MMLLFAIGSFWFWLLLLTTFISVSWFVNRKDCNGYGATIFLIFGLILFFLLGNKQLFFDLINFIEINPLKTVLYVLGYISIGAIWSIYKWYHFLIDKKNKFLQDKIDYPSSKSKLHIPKASESKDDIILWMSYWVVSLVWTMLNKWLAKIWTNVYDKLESVYDKISKKVFKDMDATDISE